MTRTASSGLVLLLTAALAVSGTPAGAATLIVDAANPELECPNADFPSINAAVAAAMPEDTILVCPGLYTENVVVNKPLKLKGAGGEKNCFDQSAADPTRDTIVDGGAFAFLLRANEVELEKFVIQQTQQGIITSPVFSGYVIEHNLIQNNFQGIIFQTSGALLARIEHNCFRENVPSSIVSFSPFSNARIEHNVSFANQFSFVLFSGGPDVTIAHNHSRDDSAIFLQFSNVTGVTIIHNDVESPGVAMWDVGGTIGLLIAHNRVRAASDEGGLVFGAFFGPPSSGLNVTNNDIRDVNQSGIHILPNSVVGSRFTHNHSLGNGVDGIRIDLGGNGTNLIERNQLRNNGEDDCHDDTIGAGTAGTANFWIDNQAETDNRLGQLCPANKQK